MPAKREGQLTQLERNFVREFVANGGNASQAARDAGYSVKQAGKTGYELLAKPQIRGLIEEASRRHELAAFDHTKLTRLDVVKMALEGVEGAKRDADWNAYQKGVDLIARLHGYIVDRKQVRVVRGVEDLTDEELRALAGPVIEGQAEAAADE